MTRIRMSSHQGGLPRSLDSLREPLTAVSFCMASHDPLDLAVRAFNNLNLSTVRADQTAAAAMRIAAMEPFAERGYAEVTVRQVASAAGGSTALAIHHYGSKDKLRAVLEERVAAFVESMLAELARAPEQGGSSTVAEPFASRLDREPAMAGYVRRLLVDGGWPGSRCTSGCSKRRVRACKNSSR
jgi:Bacterial regulatory proteins, tetR family